MHEDQEYLIEPDQNAIAIVGMSCRFPGAGSVEQYWQNLLGGIESIQVGIAPNSQILAQAELPAIEEFDYSFFGFSLKEAQLLDPQHRLLLECAWEALEDAGLQQSNRSIGVFCGSGPSSYFINNVHGLHKHDSTCGLYQSSEKLAQFMATDKEFLASRIAYKLNCCGPAVNVQAACATSMFGIQAAIQALLLGECDAALVGAAAISVPQSIPYFFEPGMPFSADGHCRPFDAKATGTVFGSGAAAVAFKRLGDAIIDGDPILAVVRSVATNNDGANRAGMSAPSVAGQARVIREAMEIACVGPEQVSYIEAHGTATPIGDPIEIKALAQPFIGRNREHTCYLGSVKGNIGHLGWAAGMAGLIKAVLIVRHKVIPPTINFETYNPQLYIEETPFTINTQPVPLAVSKIIAGVSSFGLGGNNSHLILETAPERSEGDEISVPLAERLLPLSARDTAGLKQLSASYQTFLEKCSDALFPAFVDNLQHSRSAFDKRAFVVASNRQDAIEALAKLSFNTSDIPGDSPRMALMFSGQGGEYRGMGRSLYSQEAQFKAELDRFDPACQEIFGSSITQLLFDPLNNQAIEQDIARSQPLTFALQVAMARLLLSNGTPATVVFGHSLGEYAAACIAGVFSAEQGFKIVAQRSRLLESLGNIGGMLVINGDQQYAQQLIDKTNTDLSIAALNSSTNTVVSGTREAIDQLQQLAVDAGANATRLNISRPGHSYLLEPLLDRFEASLVDVVFAVPVTPLISSVSGMLAGPEIATAAYWRRQLRETVNFRACLATAQDLRCTHLVEIGPKATLSAMVLGDAPADLRVLAMSRGGEQEHKQYLRLLGELFKAGADIHLPARAQRMPVLDGLPTYPFQRVRCWIDTNEPNTNLIESSYQTVWTPLPLAGLSNQRKVARNVLFLTPNEGANPAEISHLESAFENFQWGVLSQLDCLATEPYTVSEASFEHAFDGLWQEYPNDLDLIYLDLRHVQGTDISSAVWTCVCVLQLLNSVEVTFPEKPHLCILFTSPQPDNDQVNLQSSASSLVGMLRSVLIEEPDWKISVLQLARGQAPKYQQQASAIQLLPLTNELVVTFNQKQAFVPRLQQVAISAEKCPAFPKNLSYILLGGGGGIGQQLIECLGADQARLIYVIGRSAMPNEAVRALMNRFANLHYLSLDLVTSQGQKEGARWLKEANLGETAIFNLAVDLNDSLYATVQASDFKRAFASKCQSVLVLYQLLIDHGVEIKLLFNFSSATSILGNGGQATYGAASAFLDAAHGFLFPRAEKVLTVNWGVWGDAGKLRDDQQRQQILKASGLYGHSSEQALRFIKQLVEGPSRTVAFMNIYPQALSKRSSSCAQLLENLTAVHKEQAPASRVSVTKQILQCDDDQQLSNVIEAWLVSTIDALVGLEETAHRYDEIKDVHFKALGFDSLALVQLKNALASELGLQWSIKRFYAMQALSELQAELTSYVLTPEWRAARIDGLDNDALVEIQRPVSLQQARWISLINKDYGLRIIPYLIHCPFDAVHCRKALAQLLEENPLLRTFFPAGMPKVMTTEKVLHGFIELCVDLSAHTAEQKNKQITARIRKIALSLPKPGSGVTWAIQFIDVGEPFFIALLGVQHLEFDGKSLTLMFDRLGECLHQLANQQQLCTVEHQLHYADYAKHQQLYQQQQWNNDATFFKGLYNAFESPTVLPGHPGFSSTVVSPSSRHSIEIKGANRTLGKLADRLGFSVFNALLYVYATTMAEVIGCDQLIISAINSGRGLSEFNNVIGPFTSPLPVPITVHHDWLVGISMVARTLGAIQAYPLMHPSMLIDKVETFSGMAQDTYFSDIGINFLNYRHNVHTPGKVQIEGVEILGPVSAGLLSGANVEDMRRIPGLHLVVEINDEDLRLNFWYHSHRFSTAQVETWGQRMSQHLYQLLGLAGTADEG
ncbi:MAG: acyltransferase domain-containing protein [Moraxellaceae bacterium]|nr:MAG: acyltransferase domain-containing protein [Moraxellaceae bacterium]